MFKGRCHFILDNLDPSPVADDVAAGFDGFAFADFHADRRVEFQGPAARRRFGVAEHDADFFTELVDEDDHGLRFRMIPVNLRRAWLMRRAWRPT